MQKAGSATLYKKQGVEQWSGLWLMAADAVPEDVVAVSVGILTAGAAILTHAAALSGPQPPG